MSAIRTRLTVTLAILALAIVAAVATFQFASHGDSAGRSTFNGRLLTDPQPDHGKDCPYPPAGGYGSGKSGKVAPGRDKHCNG